MMLPRNLKKKLICTECNTVQQAFDFTGAFVYDVGKAKIFDKPISVFDFGSCTQTL